MVGDFLEVDDLAFSLDLVLDCLEGDLLEEEVDLVFFMGDMVVVGGGFAGVVAALPAVVLLVAAAILVVGYDVVITVMVC